MQKENNIIDHPAHYTYGKIECIDVVEDWDLGFHLGNAVKYICRAGVKDGEDADVSIKKAIWYLQRYVSLNKNKKTDKVYEEKIMTAIEERF